MGATALAKCSAESRDPELTEVSLLLLAVLVGVDVSLADELDRAAGKRDQISGLLQQRYGIAKDEADRQLTDWVDSQREDTRV